MQCFQLAKREHCKARIAKGELTWRVEMPKNPARDYPQNKPRTCRRNRGGKAHEYVNGVHNTAEK